VAPLYRTIMKTRTASSRWNLDVRTMTIVHADRLSFIPKFNGTLGSEVQSLLAQKPWACGAHFHLPRSRVRLSPAPGCRPFKSRGGRSRFVTTIQQRRRGLKGACPDRRDLQFTWRIMKKHAEGIARLPNPTVNQLQAPQCPSTPFYRVATWSPNTRGPGPANNRHPHGGACPGKGRFELAASGRGHGRRKSYGCRPVIIAARTLETGISSKADPGTKQKAPRTLICTR